MLSRRSQAIDKKANGYDPAKVLGAAKDVHDQLLRNNTKYELKTGFDFFDEPPAVFLG